MSLVIMLFGFIGFSFLGVREFPSVDPPVVTVSTNYVGANSDVIESQITEPLEDAVNGVAGIWTLTSVSREGSSSAGHVHRHGATRGPALTPAEEERGGRER